MFKSWTKTHPGFGLQTISRKKSKLKYFCQSITFQRGIDGMKVLDCCFVVLWKAGGVHWKNDLRGDSAGGRCGSCCHLLSSEWDPWLWLCTAEGEHIPGPEGQATHNFHIQLFLLITNVHWIVKGFTEHHWVLSWCSCSCRTVQWWQWVSECSWPASVPPCLRMKLKLWQVGRKTEHYKQ